MLDDRAERERGQIGQSADDYFEAGGDAVVRAGLHHQATGTRMLLLLVGGVMLFCYGVVLNQAPFDFGRLIGVYVATFFVVGQVINFVAFRTPPSRPRH